MILGLFISGAAFGSDLSDNIHLELSKRHALDCEAIYALGEPGAVRDALLNIASTVEAPPWAPLHAATCALPLSVDHTASMTVIEGWFNSSETSGLALVITQQLDLIDEVNAVKLADKALELAAKDERFSLYAKRALGTSKHAGVVERGH